MKLTVKKSCKVKCSSRRLIGCTRESLPGVNVDNFDVLHLSDLHLLGENLSDRYDTLLADIAEQTDGIRNLVVVVTGDIASYGKVKESEKSILAFFVRLKRSIKAKVLDVELVPGNHDIDRSRFLTTEEYETAVAAYVKLARRIYHIFGLTGRDSRVYGVSRIRCGGRSVCFLRLDTSWYFDETEFKKMVCSEFAKTMTPPSEVEDKWKVIRNCRAQVTAEYQRKQIIAVNDELARCKKRASVLRRPVELVIALAHHPLSWLIKTSCQSYADYLADMGIPDVNIWMCGHAHDVKLHYDNDDNRSAVVLMTGVGNDERTRAYHRYSIYHLSLSCNVCSILVRSSTSGLPFRDDSTLLPTETSQRTRHFCYPLKTRAPGAIVQLNTDIENPHRELFVDQRVVALMRILSSRLFALASRLQIVLRWHVIIWRMARWDQRHHRRIGHLSQLQRASLFVDYLGQMTNDIVAALLMHTDRDDDQLARELFLGKDVNIGSTCWRAHFRVTGLSALEAKKRYNTYRCVAKTAKKIRFGLKRNTSGMHDMPWKTLIKAANAHEGHVLVRSANDNPASSKTKWKDYLTSIPQCSGNSFKLKGEDRPILTFGLSVKPRDYESLVIASRILYLLEYFNLNRLISQAIDGYLHITRFSLQSLQDKGGRCK